MRVLIAEDDENSRIFLRSALAAGGHEAVLAATGTEALELARRAPPALFVSDILMPDMDGFALCRIVKQDPALRGIPFVFYSGTFVEDEDERLAYDLGAARFLVKPMPPHELVAQLSAVVAQGSPPRHARGEQRSAAELARRTEDRLTEKLYKKYREAQDKQLLIETQEATLEGIVAAIPDVLFSLEPDTLAPTYASPVVEDILGYSPDELIAEPGLWRGLVHPDDMDPVLAMFRRAEARGTAWAEGRIKGRRDAGYRWFDVRVALTRDGAGRPRRFTGVMRETTERKAAEQRERQAQRMEALGQLTGGVAHDFNNLLGVILGNLQLVGRYLHDVEGADGRVAGRLDNAMEAVRRGSELTRRLLAFARRQHLEPEVVDFNRLVAGTRELLTRTLSENIDFRFVPAADLWPVYIDAGQAENALINLAVNARDAMPEGGALTIETANVVLDEAYTREHEYMNPGDYVVVVISDTGTGMTEHERARAFEPFYTTKQPGKGTGLGLSMVYGFVKQSGGSISLYSEVGMGTTMRLYFPRAHRQAESVAASERRGAPAGGDETILVVEDDPALRDTVVTYLGQLGYRVLEAAEGSEALAVLEAHPEVALLFTDVVMPGGMNGMDLARRAREQRPRLAVLYTSGYSFAALDGHAGERPGSDELLGKPFMMEDLGWRVRERLDV